MGPTSLRMLGIATALFLAGCALKRNDLHFTSGESIVLAAEQPATLSFPPLLTRPVIVRSTYEPVLTNTIIYEPGTDYHLDHSGQIQRTATSAIPDFSTNILFAKDDFHHDQFPGFGNRQFFAYVDYWHYGSIRYTNPAPELDARLLPKTRRKLAAGQALRIIAFGDSITAGGDASTPELIFWERWAAYLRTNHPKSSIEALNGATGGDTTAQGLQRLQDKVISRSPDLVLIGFGMNDHNREGYGVPLPAFRDNLRALIDRVRAETKAEVILFSTFPPNPKWHYGSHNMPAYAAATLAVAREKHCAYADVNGLWQAYAARKKPEDLLANNINHPNDYGHWIYFQALKSLGL